MSARLSAEDYFWNKKIKLPYVIIIIVLCTLPLAFGEFAFFKSHHTEKTPVIIQPADCPPPTVVRYRMNEYAYAHPLLLSDRLEESKELLSLKNEISLMIEQRKQSGEIMSASVYLRSLNDNKWISINPGDEFNPGSLIKVPLLMTYLRESERMPGLLNRKLRLDPSRKVPPQTFNEGSIQPGKSYTIKELLYYMIAKSDNYATLLLNENINTIAFKKLFTDLGFPDPDLHSMDFRVTAADYSKFFRVLYNATYLINEDADYALSLLVESSFKDGIVKELPAGIKVAHKFGEWGEPAQGTPHQLHESGIVYVDDNPYLITVFTKGKTVSALPQVISDISKRVFDRMVVEKGKS
jgi:beta-lactamase class A